MKTRMALRNGVVAMVFALGVGSVQAGFTVQFDPLDDERVIAINNLDVNGTPYDVTFTLSTTAQNVYGTFDLMGNNYDFNTIDAAQSAANAVVDALNTIAFDVTVGSPNEGFGSILFRVPYASDVVFDLDTVIFWEGARGFDPPTSWTVPGKSDGDSYNLGERVYARFAVVPAPATAWLLAPVIAALGGRRRRRTI